MMRFSPPLLFLALGASCNLSGGYSNLGEPVDPVESFGTIAHTTWIRTTDDHVETWVFSGVGPEAAEPGRFFHSIAQLGEGDSYTETGDYEIDRVERRIGLELESRWVNPDETDVPILQRQGAYRESLDEKATLSYEAERAEDGELWIRLAGDVETQRLLHFDDVMERVDSEEEEGAAHFLWLYFLAVDNSRWRIPGFGGPSQSMYFGKRTDFTAVISGKLILELQDILSPKNITEYYAHEDLSGLVLSGKTTDFADVSGDGWQYGSVQAVFSRFIDPDEDPEADYIPYSGEPLYDATVYLGNPAGDDGGIIVTGGSPSDGVYRVTFDGETFEVPWNFRELYPIEDLLDPDEGES